MKLTPIFDEAIKESKALMALYDSPAATGALSAGISPEVFLRAALVFALAAVDKILHEAISKHFTSLARGEILDRFVKFKVSKAYEIALAARIRAGAGGARRRRPGHDIKTEVLTEIYKDSYLSNRMLQEICAACDKDKIFSKFAAVLGGSNTAQQLQNRWSRIYQRRNHIAHESDIQRKERMRKVSFNPVDVSKMKSDIKFIESFGRFLANNLE
jgi:hypothetical protein